MKKIIFTALCCFAILTLRAQTDSKIHRFSFTTTICSGIVMSSPSSNTFMWQILGHYKLTERLLLGAGTGLSLYEKVLIPLYGDIKFQITKTWMFTPFVELGLGYSFAPSNDASGGFFINPSVGVQYIFKNQMKLHLAIGYELQNLERIKTQTNDYFSSSYLEKLSHHSISIKLGLSF